MTALTDSLKARRQDERAAPPLDLLAAKGRPAALRRQLLYLREAKRATLSQAATAAGVFSDVWATWESGEAVPTQEQLDTLAAAWSLSSRDRTTLGMALVRAAETVDPMPDPAPPAQYDPFRRNDPANDALRPAMDGIMAGIAPARPPMADRVATTVIPGGAMVCEVPAPPNPPASPKPAADPLAGFELVTLEVVAPETVVVSLEPNSGDIRLRKGARELIGTDVRRVDVLVHRDSKALAVVPHVGEGEGRCLASRGDISVTPIRTRLAKAGWPAKAAYRAERIPGKPGFIVRLSGKEGS